MVSSYFLVGNREICAMLGTFSRQRVYLLTRRPDFPRAAAELAQGHVWFGDEVAAWIAARGLGPGSAGEEDQGEDEAVATVSAPFRATRLRPKESGEQRRLSPDVRGHARRDGERGSAT